MSASLAMSLGLFCLLVAAISAYGYLRYVRPARMYAQLADPFGPPAPAFVLPGRQALLALMDRLGRYLPLSPQEGRLVRHDLTAGGFRSQNALEIYYGIRLLSAATLFFVSLWLRGLLPENPVLRTVLVVAGPFAGYSLPGLVLERLIGRRQTRLRLSLPDALDLLVISVEAGLGLDQAILNVSRELGAAHREIADELGLVNLEMRAGKRRMDALRNLADRTGEPEVRRLIAILVQSDRFGTSMADALRTHSDAMRVRRRQEAEERAAKVGVKLVFPIFFFILPSMLVVAAGPALLQIFKYLFPLMRNFKS